MVKLTLIGPGAPTTKTSIYSSLGGFEVWEMEDTLLSTKAFTVDNMLKRQSYVD